MFVDGHSGFFLPSSSTALLTASFRERFRPRHSVLWFICLSCLVVDEPADDFAEDFGCAPLTATWRTLSRLLSLDMGYEPLHVEHALGGPCMVPLAPLSPDDSFGRLFHQFHSKVLLVAPTNINLWYV
ncbi:hypothetical protein BDZ89DRAFT_1145713 [Hymenopellis radicata]|nr:hypothetical protein BDZ89DRAFT_1145713 [Hymenopellis radicata]